MYTEFKAGEKHASTGADRSLSHEAFKDCGLMIEDNEIVVDIDHLPKQSIEAMIKEFNIKTQTVWTERGVHLYFKKPLGFSRRRDGICKLGFQIEQHTNASRPNGMTIKRNGVLRKIDNNNVRQVMPHIFEVGSKKKPYQDLTGLEEGDGRNKGLFQHRKALNNCQDWEKILTFINKYVFSDPMADDELSGIVRDMSIETDADDRFFVAEQFMKEHKTVLYSGLVWWVKDGDYISDSDDSRLKRAVYQYCEGKDTRFIDEIIKQIKYRTRFFDEGTVFPIKFKNGILRNGKFIEIKNYTDFTPYQIDIDYKENAEPVKEVDDYIDNLTSSDPDYRKLLSQVLGYVMVTDPERIRSLGKFFMFRGDGANGKGTLLQIMEKIFNAKNCTNLSIKQLADDRFRVTMIGKLANLGDDIEPETISNAELKILKNISTADTVATRRLYCQSESAQFTTKLFFTTNSDIKSFEKGYAFKRRILWLPMFNKVEKPDPNFIGKMTSKEALEYWIRFIVDGYISLYEERRWQESEIVTEYNEQYHEDNNVSAQFAKELDPDTEIVNMTIDQIRAMFSEWSTDERKFSAKLFKEAVWDMYRIGIGKAKIGGSAKWVFLQQDNTKQKLRH